MKILVVGGAGYIGSHMLKILHGAGMDVLTLDNLSSGYRDAVRYGDCVQGDLGDTDALHSLFRKHRPEAVFHFASSIQVGESMQSPRKYYRNNVVNTINLLDVMLDYGVNRFVFSSSAAVYGRPERSPIDEAHPIAPLSPYGKSKAMVEQVLEDYASAYGLRSACLRYFNAAGADMEGELGEQHDPETHLIPLILQAISGRRSSVTVFGRDYDTPDGTCIRDYVHVQDLCDAHLLALRFLESSEGCHAFNLGNGQGFSVQQVIDAACRVAGKKIDVIEGERRAGDPDTLIASSAKAHAVLGWQPRRTRLDDIIADAWRWERKMGHTVE